MCLVAENYSAKTRFFSQQFERFEFDCFSATRRGGYAHSFQCFAAVLVRLDQRHAQFYPIRFFPGRYESASRLSENTKR